MSSLPPKDLSAGVRAQPPVEQEHIDSDQPEVLQQPLIFDSEAKEQEQWLNIHTKRDGAAPSYLDHDNKKADVFSIFGMLIGIIGTIAAILALFKGWKFWKNRKDGYKSGADNRLVTYMYPNMQHPWRDNPYGAVGNIQAVYQNTTLTTVFVYDCRNHP